MTNANAKASRRVIGAVSERREYGLRLPGYQTSLGLPVRWQDELSGALPTAVQAYSAAAAGRGNITREQLALVQEYVCYYLAAPCWDSTVIRQDGEWKQALQTLRTQAARAVTVKGIRSLIYRCLEYGIAPF